MQTYAVGIWTNKDRPTLLDDAEDFSLGASGGRWKQWLAGGLLAALPIIFGLLSLKVGYTTLFGRGTSADLRGAAGQALAIAYIAGGLFLHFHYLWGLSERLRRFSQAGKVLSMLVLVHALLFAIYEGFEWSFFR